MTVVDAEFAALAAGLPGRTVLTGEDHESWLAAHPAEDPGHAGEPGDIVVQLYTSGTTGLPKGHQRVHRPGRPAPQPQRQDPQEDLRAPYWEGMGRTIG